MAKLHFTASTNLFHSLDLVGGNGFFLGLSFSGGPAAVRPSLALGRRSINRNLQRANGSGYRPAGLRRPLIRGVGWVSAFRFTPASAICPVTAG